MSTLHAVIFGMSEQPPTFVARKNPGSGWGVDILWPDGETEAVKGFITEHDAAKWIAEHSRGVAGKYERQVTPSALGDLNKLVK